MGLTLLSNNKDKVAVRAILVILYKLMLHKPPWPTSQNIPVVPGHSGFNCGTMERLEATVMGGEKKELYLGIYFSL